ncbi:MAG TPA: DUF1015 domain-containing protein [Bacteroidia bacterium]|nr:DUF1015 domain-containing protein [Bacteroidia bacterium]
MAIVLPFKAIRPVQDKVQQVASRSVDGYHHDELHERLASNPYSFLHVINPDFSDGHKTKAGSAERLQKIKARFKQFREQGIFEQDQKPAYYIYRQVNQGHGYLGIIACTSIDDYLNGVIKIHEQTITTREEKLKEYLDVCEFNAEPVLFCYPNDEIIDQMIMEVSQSPSTCDFVTEGVRHTLWVLNDVQKVKTIALEFARIPAIYIADGHHRSASSALLGKERRKANPHHIGKEAYNFYLGVFFSESQLKIYDFNRVVKDMNGMSLEELLQKLRLKFDVREVPEKLHAPEKQHEFSMYVKGHCFVLEAKHGTYLKGDPVTSLDAFILTEHILSPLLNIHDLKTDERITFIPGIKGQEALKSAVDEGKAEVAFGLYPVTMEHLKWIADTHNIMPPKTTWVEPKMKSGLVIYSFEEN